MVRLPLLLKVRVGVVVVVVEMKLMLFSTELSPYPKPIIHQGSLASSGDAGEL